MCLLCVPPSLLGRPIEPAIDEALGHNGVLGDIGAPRANRVPGWNHGYLITPVRCQVPAVEGDRCRGPVAWDLFVIMKFELVYGSGRRGLGSSETESAEMTDVLTEAEQRADELNRRAAALPESGL